MQLITGTGSKASFLVRILALRDNRAGIAMVEFAMALPIFLAISMFGIETGNVAITRLRVEAIADMVADNAGRFRNSIDESDVNEVMIGARFSGNQIGLGANGRVFLSSFTSNGLTGAKAGYTIVWQRCFGAKNVTSSYGVQGDGAIDASMSTGMGSTSKIEPVPGTALMFAEVNYTYKPLISDSFFGPMVFSTKRAFTVRQRSAETLTNTSSLTTAQKRLCDAAHLSST